MMRDSCQQRRLELITFRCITVHVVAQGSVLHAKGISTRWLHVGHKYVRLPAKGAPEV